MGDLYERDILEWSGEQAALLRRLAAGDVLNDAELDWPRIAAEIESVGRGQSSAVRSLLIQALIHELKAAAWPLSREVPHWRAEARRFRIDAAEAFAPTMRQLIDMADLHTNASRAMPDHIDGQPPRRLAATCPVTLDQLLAAP